MIGRPVNNHRAAIILVSLLCLAFLSVFLKDGMSFIFVLFFILLTLLGFYGPREDRKFIAMTLLLAFGVRVVLMYLFHLKAYHDGFGGFVFGDDRLYSLKALKLSLMLQGLPYAGISDVLGVDYGLNPFTSILTLFYAVFKPVYFSSKMINCLLGSVTPLLAYAATKRSFPGIAPRIALLLMSFYPSIVQWSICNLKDPFIIFLITLILYCILTLERNVSGVLKIAIIPLAMLQLKGLQTLQLYALISTFAIFAYFICVRWFRNSTIAFFSWIFLIVNISVWGILQKATILRHLNVLIVIQNGMRDCDSAGFSIYGENFIRNVIAGVMDLPGLAAAYGHGVAHFLFAPFPWAISSANQLMAYPQVVLWYSLLCLFLVGLFDGAVRCPRKTFFAAAFFIIGVSLFALGEGNVGVVFRHRDYFAPVVFIFSAAGITRVFFRKRGSV